MKIQKKKGISLIVLVITIIVMIILAAVIIISLNNSGIIGKANTAVKEYNEQEVKHIAEVAWAEAYLDPNITTQEKYELAVKNALIANDVRTDDYGLIVTTKGVEIVKGWLQDGLNITKGNKKLEAGDLIQYNAGVQGYNGAWKVLGAEAGNLLIMSTNDVGTLELSGLNGNGSTTSYGILNGIARLNQICEPYGNGIGAVGARSIKEEDINKIIGFDKTTYVYYDDNLGKYGNNVTYTWNGSNINYSTTNGQNGTFSGNYENGFNYIDFNIMEKVTANVGDSIPTLISNYYEFRFARDFNSNAEEMLFGGDINTFSNYWTISPYILATNSDVYYGLYAVFDAPFEGFSLYDSHGSGSICELGVRAVVKLSPKVIIGEKNNTLGWSYSI